MRPLREASAFPFGAPESGPIEAAGPIARPYVWVLCGFLFLGLLVRLWVLFGLGTAWNPEAFEYDQLAQNLLAGKGYTYLHLGTVYRSFHSGIFYVLLTTALYAIFPKGQVAVLVAQSFFSVLLALVVFSICRALWDDRAGGVASILSFYHPAILYYDCYKLHPLSFDALAIALVTRALLFVSGPRYLGRGLMAGLFLGVAILQRGTMGLLVPFGWIWLVWRLPGMRRACAGCVAFGIGVGLALVPWVARNYAIHGGLVLMTTTPELFWRGNVSYSLGSSYLPSGRTVLDEAPQAFRRNLLAKDEWGQYQLFRELDASIIRATPMTFLRNVLRKFFYFWTFAPQSGILYPSMYFYMYNGYYVFVVGLAMLGAIHLARSAASRPASFHGLVLLITVFLSVSFTQSVFYVELRHRWGIEPLLLVLTSVGLLSVWSRRTCVGRTTLRDSR